MMLLNMIIHPSLTYASDGWIWKHEIIKERKDRLFACRSLTLYSAASSFTHGPRTGKSRANLP